MIHTLWQCLRAPEIPVEEWRKILKDEDFIRAMESANFQAMHRFFWVNWGLADETGLTMIAGVWMTVLFLVWNLFNGVVDWEILFAWFFYIIITSAVMFQIVRGVYRSFHEGVRYWELAERVKQVQRESVLAEVRSVEGRSAQPQWIQAEVRTQDGRSEGMQWIKLSDVKSGPIRHEALSEEDMARLQRLHARLQPIDGLSLDCRVDLFKRDMNPGREITICERIANICYHAYHKFGPFTPEQRREIYALVTYGCSAPTHEYLKRNPPKLITMSQAEQILGLPG